MPTQSICPNCKKPLDHETLDGLCAACLLLAGVGSTMDQGPDSANLPVASVGTQIGRYKLLEQIGEGGFGVVYMAEQQEPVRRRVALKIIKPGMDSKQIIARFEAERQALAMMDHENIARVLDAGTSDSGRLYFVMELVRGLPITEYCDRNKLVPRQRLELMIDVCRAIQHAHQKGIIHRDIKPSNVLVTLYDGRPVTKVIDFGVAKAIQQPLTEKTMFTRFGQVMGTLEYMSPEQAEMSGLDIDTRGDIYSLGVLMYELLTGSTPLSREKLRAAAFDEVLRIIRNEEPPRPSLRLDNSGREKQTISSLRGMAPDKLESVLRGELDWIVMKALEKDRARRYDNANEFAKDIQRFLDNEPIDAAPPSSYYRFKKFIWKHRTAVSTAIVVLATVLIGLFASLFSYARAVESREEANRMAVELQQERVRLVESLNRTEKEEAAKAAALTEKALALEQRTQALKRSDTLRLAAESLLVADEDPGLALKLAADALQLDDQSVQANSSFLNALRLCREIKTIMFDDVIVNCAFANLAQRAFLQFNDRVEVWDISLGKSICQIELPEYLNVQKIVPHPNGTQFLLLIAGWKSYRNENQNLVVTDRAARIFDVRLEKEICVLRGHTDRIVEASYSKEGTVILTASWDGTARVWNADDGELEFVADYNEKQGSAIEGDRAQIVDQLMDSRFEHISLADAEFNADGTVSLFPLNGQKTSVLMFEALKNLDMDAAIKKAGASVQGLFEIPDPEMDPELAKISDESTSSGGTGISFKLVGIKACKQIVSGVDGKFERATREHSEQWSHEKDKSSKLLRRERLTSPTKSKPRLAKIMGKEILVVRHQHEPLTLRGHRYPVLNLAYDANRDHVVSCDQQSLRVWKTDPILKELNPGKKSSISSTSIDDSSQFAATGHVDGVTNIWNIKSGELEAELIRDYEFTKEQPNRLNPDIEFVQFNVTGNLVVSRSSEHAVVRESIGDENGHVLKTDVIRVWDWRKGKLKFRLSRRAEELDQPRYLGFAAALFQDDDSLITIDNGQHAVTGLNDEGSLAASYSGDGLRVINEDGKPLGPFLAIRCWNIETGVSEFEIFSDQLGAQPRISRSGKFATIHVGEDQQLVELSSGINRGSIPDGVFIQENSLFVTEDGQQAIVLAHEIDKETGCFARVIETQNQTVVEAKVDDFEELARTKIVAASFCNRNRRLAVGLESGHLLMFDITRWKTQRLHAHSESISQISFSNDGQRIITASADRFLRVWDTGDLKPLLEFGPHDEPLQSFEIDPSDRFVVATIGGDKLKRWPLHPRSLLSSFESPFNPSVPRALTRLEANRYELNNSQETDSD